jgi:hypothetical protein
MDVTFLQARMPLRKRFDEHGKHSYPNVSNFTSTTLDVPDLKSFHMLLIAQAAMGNCLLKGVVTRPLVDESRAGSTNRDELTWWICLDCDGMDTVHSADEFLERIGLSGISYIQQLSSSSYLRKDGVLDTRFNVHIFMQLDQAINPHHLKLWLKHKNFTCFPNDIELTASDVALRWGLDITTCQNDKLLYIAPPDVHTPYEDTLKPEERITYHPRPLDEVPAADMGLLMLDPAKVKKQEMDFINTLRLDKGLEKKRATAFNLKGNNVEYMANPSHAQITDTREDRGFVYFNLNGGDSWAYYHPADNHEFIFNFKGEPTYRTEELLPEYYAFKTKSDGIKKAGGRIPVGFRGLQDGVLYNGFYDEDRDELELYAAKRTADVIIFLAQYGVVVESLPTFRLIHDPLSQGPRIDLDNETVNLFTVSILEKEAKPDTSPTPIIDRIIKHVMGDNNVQLFINWFAYIVQNKTATGTGIVCHGCQGTGKGVLFHHVLRPIIGDRNAKLMRTANFEDSFNGFLENTILLGIDEVDVPESRQDKRIMADLKNYMTEKTISIRKMHASAYEVQNRLNFIYFSNQRNPVLVEQTDRRFNIMEYRPDPISLTADEIDQIQDELPGFMYQLLMYPVNERMAKTAAITAAKLEMQELSETSVDQIARALTQGKANVLHSFCEDPDEVLDLDKKLLFKRYNDLIREIICEGRTRFTRTDIKVIFEACVGRVPDTPAKFTKYLHHHGIKVGLNRIDGEIVRGSLVVEWTDDKDWLARAQREYGVMKTVSSDQQTKELPSGDTTMADTAGSAGGIEPEGA